MAGKARQISTSTTPKPFVFVLMPFDEKFRDVYELGIKAACKDAGAHCERVDEQMFDEDILERIYTQIAKADIIVAEMTDRNPNVFYETGYAHALNKRTILMTQRAEDIPFDLKHRSHILYGGKITDLKGQLEERVRWCIRYPQESLSKADLNLQFYLNGTPLDQRPQLIVELQYVTERRDGQPPIHHRQSQATMELMVHNGTKSIVPPSAFRLALVTRGRDFVFRGSGGYGPFDSQPCNMSSGISLPDNRVLFNVLAEEAMFPDAWTSIRFHLELTRGLEVDELIEQECELRLFTAVAPKAYSFKIQVKAKVV